MSAPPILFSLVSALALVVVFGTLYATHRERFLLIWTGAWVLWLIRYTYGLLVGQEFLTQGEFVLPALVVLRSTVMLFGAYALDRRIPPPAWLVVLGAHGLWVTFLGLSGMHVEFAGVHGLEHYIVFSTALVWCGVLFLRSDLPVGPEKVVAGVALILFGLAQASFPFSGQLPGWYQWGAFALAHSLQIVVGLGVVMAYMRGSQIEAQRLADELAEALTRALADHLPICAHCKSIQNEAGGWHRLESYVTNTTGARFSHGICPTCTEEHFGVVT